jgi:hypothetical protein
MTHGVKTSEARRARERREYIRDKAPLILAEFSVIVPSETQRKMVYELLGRVFDETEDT